MARQATITLLASFMVLLVSSPAWAEQPTPEPPPPPAPATPVPAPTPDAPPPPDPAPEAAPAPEPAPEAAPVSEPAPAPEPAPAIAATTPAAKVVLTRPRFRMALPAGYAEADESQRSRFLEGYPAQQSALVVAQSGNAAKDAFVGSLVVLPLGGDLRGLLVDDALCRTAADASAKQTRGTVSWVETRDFGYGPTCQWRLAVGAGTHQAIITRVVTSGGQYAVTCHFDGRDAAGEPRCLAAAASFVFQ